MKIAWLPKDTSFAKIFGLDAFRGLAALLVLLFHYWTIYLNNREIEVLNVNITIPFRAGHLGVDIFFVISGFLIFLSLLRSSTLTSYFRKRILRIVPLAVCFTLVLFLVRLDFSKPAWLDFGAHLLFLQAFFEQTYHGLNPVMWTLSVEALFYLLLPLLLFLGRRKLWHFWLLLLTLVALNFWYRAWVSQFFGEWDQLQRVFYSEQLWGRFDQFVWGIGVGTIWIFRHQLFSFVQKIYSILMLTGGLILAFGFFQFALYEGGFRDILWMQLFLHSVVALGFALFLLGFLFAPSKVQKIFAPRFLLFLGLISYSVYLWHFPVILQLQKVFPNPAWGFSVSLVGTVFLSYLSYVLIEEPFLRKKKAGAIGF